MTSYREMMRDFDANTKLSSEAKLENVFFPLESHVITAFRCAISVMSNVSLRVCAVLDETVMTVEYSSCMSLKAHSMRPTRK